MFMDHLSTYRIKCNHARDSNLTLYFFIFVFCILYFIFCIQTLIKNNLDKHDILFSPPDSKHLLKECTQYPVTQG